MPRKKHRHRADGEHFSLDIPFNRTATNDGLPEKLRIHRDARCIFLDFLNCARAVSLARVHRQSSFMRLRRAASWLSLHFDGMTSAMSCSEFSGGTVQAGWDCDEPLEEARVLLRYW